MEKAQGKASTATKKPQASKAQVAPEVVKETPKEPETTAIRSAGHNPIMIPAESIMNRLYEAETGMELTTSYRTKEEWYELKNVPIKAFFMGVEDATTSEGKHFKAASFISGDNVFVAGQKVLVDTVQNLPIGQGVVITFLGSKKNATKDGQTQLFSVKRLKVNINDILQEANVEAEEVTNG